MFWRTLWQKRITSRSISPTGKFTSTYHADRFTSYVIRRCTISIATLYKVSLHGITKEYLSKLLSTRSLRLTSHRKTRKKMTFRISDLRFTLTKDVSAGCGRMCSNLLRRNFFFQLHKPKLRAHILKTKKINGLAIPMRMLQSSAVYFGLVLGMFQNHSAITFVASSEFRFRLFSSTGNQYVSHSYKLPTTNLSAKRQKSRFEN